MSRIAALLRSPQRLLVRVSLLLILAAVAACDQTPVAPVGAPSDAELYTAQRPIVLNSDGYAASHRILPGNDAALVLASAPASYIRMAGIGGNFGNRAANIVFSTGDLDGEITRITSAQFDALSVQQLRDSYDVLLFTWASPSMNADWNTRLLPYLQLGGGIIWEDPSNAHKLTPAITAHEHNVGGPFTVTPVPDLSDGITGVFANSHTRFTSWSPEFSPFIHHSTGVVGLYGEIPGGGRMVLTGPDHDFHAHRGSNAYDLLVKEILWVAAGAAVANEPPAADAGPDQAVECESHHGTAVTLDGSGSSDPDGDIVLYEWLNGDGAVIATGAMPSVSLGMGVHMLTLRVTDDGGLTDEDTVTITVEDTTPPDVTLVVSPTTLWPANHQLRSIAVTASATDACSEELVIIGHVVSDEPDNAVGNGDGNTTGDIRVTRADGTVLVSSNANPSVAFNPLTDTLELRAERAGNGAGRTYTIVFTATDSSGNFATATATVKVPRNAGSAAP